MLGSFRFRPYRKGACLPAPVSRHSEQWWRKIQVPFEGVVSLVFWVNRTLLADACSHVLGAVVWDKEGEGGGGSNSKRGQPLYPMRGAGYSILEWGPSVCLRPYHSRYCTYLDHGKICDQISESTSASAVPVEQLPTRTKLVPLHLSLSLSAAVTDTPASATACHTRYASNLPRLPLLLPRNPSRCASYPPSNRPRLPSPLPQNHHAL